VLAASTKTVYKVADKEISITLSSAALTSLKTNVLNFYVVSLLFAFDPSFARNGVTLKNNDGIVKVYFFKRLTTPAQGNVDLPILATLANTDLFHITFPTIHTNFREYIGVC